LQCRVSFDDSEPSAFSCWIGSAWVCLGHDIMGKTNAGQGHHAATVVRFGFFFGEKYGFWFPCALDFHPLLPLLHHRLFRIIPQRQKSSRSYQLVRVVPLCLFSSPLGFWIIPFAHDLTNFFFPFCIWPHEFLLSTTWR
jgi:hypothetical protein